MTKTALYLLLISSGLLIFYFVAIIYTWFSRYFGEIASSIISRRLRRILSSFIDANENGKIIQRVNAVQELKSFIKYSTKRKEALINIIIECGEEFIDSNHYFLMNLYQVTGIKQFLIKRLTSKSFFIKSLACRQLGELKINNSEAQIFKLISCEDNDVRYNVMLALARLGDIKRLVNILTNNTDKINMSYRAIIEIVSALNGSKEDLIERTLKLTDDNYIKGILIKAAADYKIEGLQDYYLKYLKNDDKNIRIACIRALSVLGNSDNEDHLINMLEDKDWEVRAASAKSLEKVGTSKSFTALGKTTGDSEWWVRHNAASTLVLLPGGKKYASKIINGNDKYAREAIVSVIELEG